MRCIRRMNKNLKDMTERVSLLQARREALKLQEENEQLQERVSQLEEIVNAQPSFFSRMKRKVWSDNVALVTAYGAEAYFLGIMLHEKMHSWAGSWWKGHDGYLQEFSDSHPFPFGLASIAHIFADGAVGGFSGAATGAAIGGLAALTYQVIKEQEYAPIGKMGYAVVSCGLGGAAGGLLGAWFSDPSSIMIGAYAGSALGIGYDVKNGGVYD